MEVEKRGGLEVEKGGDEEIEREGRRRLGETTIMWQHYFVLLCLGASH